MKIRRPYQFGVWALALVGSACQASTPSQELMTARNEYAKVQNSSAPEVAPAAVQEADEALEAAEKAHEAGPGSKAERNYAYLSTRKSQLAMAAVREEQAREYQLRAERAKGASENAEELARTQSELEAAEAAMLREQQAGTDMTTPETAGEVVISRTGVFFETGSASLSPEARKQLDIVASELLAKPSSDESVIEGYADPRGDGQMNLELSQERADAVREYLVSRGVPAERLRAVGFGERDPIVSDDAPVGLATSRRVEIATARVGDEQPSRQPVGGTDADSIDDPEQQEQSEPEPQQPLEGEPRDTPSPFEPELQLEPEQ